MFRNLRSLKDRLPIPDKPIENDESFFHGSAVKKQSLDLRNIFEHPSSTEYVVQPKIFNGDVVSQRLAIKDADQGAHTSVGKRCDKSFVISEQMAKHDVNSLLF